MTNIANNQLLNINSGFHELETWVPIDDSQIFYVYENEVVRAKYEECFGLEPDTGLSTYYIIKNHYKKRMEDIIKHINYFLTYYDEDKELFVSTLSVKSIIDQYPKLSLKGFRDLLTKRIVTPSFIEKIKKMADDLYTLNINTDEEGKFKNTPKITNDQAKGIVAFSFCLRMIVPLCLHYSNTNKDVVENKSYIKCFDNIYMKIMHMFEAAGVKFYNALCKFIQYRVNKSTSSDSVTWYQKKQLKGLVPALFLEDIIHEVVLVKSLHKLSYNRSCVSFIDGIIHGYLLNFKQENYVYKPFEIDSDDTSGSDSDDYLSHAEALEMAEYKIDESNAMITDINSKKVIKAIRKRYNFKITDEEIAFYTENCKFNEIVQFMLNTFYPHLFKSSTAINTISKKNIIILIIILKKYLQAKGMVILPQLCTAKVHGKFKDSVIKNSKFTEKLTSSAIYRDIIQEKYKYIQALGQKEDLVMKNAFAIINSTFEFVDYMIPEINGMVYNDVNVETLASEYLEFLSIV